MPLSGFCYPKVIEAFWLSMDGKGDGTLGVQMNKKNAAKMIKKGKK